MVPSILNIHENYLEELKKRLDAWDPMQCIGDVYFNVVSIIAAYQSVLFRSDTDQKHV